MNSSTNRRYSLPGVWHWVSVEFHAQNPRDPRALRDPGAPRPGPKTVKTYSPGERVWKFSADATVASRSSCEPPFASKYDYRPHEMLHIYAAPAEVGEWFAVEWLSECNIILYPSGENDCLPRSIELRRDEGSGFP